MHELPEAGSARVAAFIETYCRVVKGGTGNPAGALIVLRPWQRAFLADLYDPVPRPRQALLSVARKNGKSLLGASLALFHLLADGEESAEVLLASSDERTARVIFNVARRQVELDPAMSGVLQVFQDRIYHPASDSILEALPADGSRIQGRNPSASLVDEVHVTHPDTWDALALAGGTRARPLTLGLSTECGADPDNLMARLVEHGRAGDDPAFVLTEFTAPVGCEMLDRTAWAAANPMLGDTLDPDHLAAVARTTREPAFRRFHLNQRVSAAGSWLPSGSWDACSTGLPIPDGTAVVIALDGSFSQDATGLVAATVGVRPHLDKVGLWTPPAGDPDYRIPVLQVEDAIRAACRRFDVVEIVCDPFRWGRSMQVLASERLPVVEMPQTSARMTPATTGVYEAVVNRELTHSGDLDLARHVGNATVKDDVRGVRLAKQREKSPLKIDLAVCAVMAHSRATWHGTRKTTRRRVVAW